MSVRISVGICTFRRAHVRETVLSVLAQQPPGQDFEILVCDDDPGGSARAHLADLETGGTRLRYLACGSRNVAVARNRLLDEADGEWIAFLDDDEIADPRWLAELMAAQARFDADIVKGFVHGVYPGGTSGWIRRADPYTRDYGATGTTPRRLASGNSLFRVAQARVLGLRFNPAFGRSGGEDTDFFGRLHAGGARAVACREAVVHEIVPPGRVTPAYMKSRWRRSGQTRGRKLRTGAASRSSLPRELAVALAAALLLWPYPLLRLLPGGLAFRVFTKFCYGLGWLEGLAGFGSEEMA